MKIQMIETRRGSSDGFEVKQYHKGAIYTIGETIGDTLAKHFINAGWAERIQYGL